MKKSFINKIILITGASSGIGAATAKEFAKAGAEVLLVARNESKLQQVATEPQKQEKLQKDLPIIF